jgi:hypothetical protein
MAKSLGGRSGKGKRRRHIWSRNRTWTWFSTIRYVCSTPFRICLPLADLQDGEGEHHALQGSADMPAYPYVNFEPLLPRFGHDITAFQHHLFPQLVWTTVGCLNHVFNVEKVKTIILRRKGVLEMPGLDEEVDRVQKPLLPPHFRTNFVAEKKVVRIELSRLKSLQKAHVSTVRPNRSPNLSSWSTPTADSASAIPDSDGLSDVEIESTPSASSSSLRPSRDLQDRPEPNIEARRYHKHSRKSTAQRFAAHDSSSTPSSPVSVSEISWCLRSDSPLSLPTSSRSSPVVTSLPTRSRPASIELSQVPLPHTRTTVSSTSS